MKIHFYARGSPRRQRNIESRRQFFFKTVADLEFTQRAILLIPIIKQPVGKKRNARSLTPAPMGAKFAKRTNRYSVLILCDMSRR